MRVVRVNGVIVALILSIVVGAIIDLVTGSIPIAAATAGAFGAVTIPAVFLYSRRLLNKAVGPQDRSVRNVISGGSQGVQVGRDIQVNYFGLDDSSGVANIRVSGDNGDGGKDD